MTFHDKKPSPCLDDQDYHETPKAVNNFDKIENGRIIDSQSTEIEDECTATVAKTDRVEIIHRRKLEATDNDIATALSPPDDASQVVVDKPSLLFFPQVPAHLRFSKYVLGHYRPPLDIRHNETSNILTLSAGGLHPVFDSLDASLG